MRAGRVAAVLVMVVGAVGAGALPAAAAPSYTVDIDCLTSEDVHLVLPVDGSVAVTTTNCVEVHGSDTVIAGDLPSLTVTQATPGSVAFLYLRSTPESESPVVVTLEGGTEIPSPSGAVLNDTATVTIPQEAPTQFVADSDAFCTVDAGDAATYGTAQLQVLTSGTYTLRVVDVDPTTTGIDSRQPWHPSHDPVIALYAGAFDPANPSANIVACDDDGDWVGTSASGTLVHDRFSEIAGAALEPGLYTIVFTTYNNISAADWSAGTGAAESFTPSAATTTIEIWGPDGGAGVPAAPSVTTNPADQQVLDGATASFTAAASGYPTPTAQWQRSRDGGATWTDVPEATGTTLSFTAALADSGDQFHAVFTAGEDVVVTSAATLTVTAAPSVTTNPADRKASDGGTATFTAAASGTPTPTVRWQQSRDRGATWTDVPGATSTTLSVAAVLANNGYQFRAVFTAGEDVVVTSAATLTVTAVLAASGSSSQAGLMLALVVIGAGAGLVGLSRRRTVVEVA